MGNRFEVWGWVNNGPNPSAYSYELVWHGQSRFLAFVWLIKAKRKAYGCVKLEWRD